MTAGEREEIRISILEELDNLRTSISTLNELSDAELQDDANDWFSSKESNISKDINEQALARYKQRIILLSNVLKRIDNPDYGICVECKKQIPIERLKAVPTAIRCMSCNR